MAEDTNEHLGSLGGFLICGNFRKQENTDFEESENDFVRLYC